MDSEEGVRLSTQRGKRLEESTKKYWIGQAQKLAVAYAKDRSPTFSERLLMEADLKGWVDEKKVREYFGLPENSSLKVEKVLAEHFEELLGRLLATSYFMGYMDGLEKTKKLNIQLVTRE